MKQHNDFLVEIHTEELPPKSLKKLGEQFFALVKEKLQQTGITFDAENSRYFAAPRRLAVLIAALAAHTPDQVVERKGPAINAAFNDKGEPTPACIGFAKSCGVMPSDLFTIKSAQGEWVGFNQTVKGKTVNELLPQIVTDSLTALPIAKRMRWGSGEVAFVRPVHSVIMLYGKEIIPATILGCVAGNKTQGHRFLADTLISIPNATDYESVLEEKGKVIADFKKRQEVIVSQIKQLAHVLWDQSLLDEVTGLVEWPTAMIGAFDEAFLQVPKEVLISSMQDHQRYFPVINQDGRLLPHFITVSNIDPADKAHVIHGNERVLRARLSDAKFFFEEDKKVTLESRLEKLKHIVFQAKLGTLYDKAERLSKLCGFLAPLINASEAPAKRAGLLAKTDLTTHMVNEFPELQGVMGGYYAKHDGEDEEVSTAMQAQYQPIGAGGVLPAGHVGKTLALADRIDTLVGYFAINQVPTGDKDPYGLRRAAIAILRILVETKINIDLKAVFAEAMKHYTIKIENQDWQTQLLTFMQERMRVYSIDKGIQPDVFAAVAALGVNNPLDVWQRIKAVQAFKALAEAESLSVANKRVKNILDKYEGNIGAEAPEIALFESEAETRLFADIQKHQQQMTKDQQNYEMTLKTLSALREPVDQFFDQVMVMTDDKAKQVNRIRLLHQLRQLFLQVADIALLQ